MRAVGRATEMIERRELIGKKRSIEGVLTGRVVHADSCGICLTISKYVKFNVKCVLARLP